MEWKVIMKFYYVYIVQCFDNKLYTGITNNIKRRLEEHNKGISKTSFTYSRRPVKLIFQQEFIDVNQAISFEKKIKKWSRMKKIALVNGDYETIQKLAACKNETHFKNNIK